MIFLNSNLILNKIVHNYVTEEFFEINLLFCEAKCSIICLKTSLIFTQIYIYISDVKLLSGFLFYFISLWPFL